MINARDTALAIIEHHPRTAMLIALDIVRIISDERLRKKVERPVETQSDYQRVVAAVCSYYRVTELEVEGRERLRRLTEPRQMVWLLLRKQLRWTTLRIARQFDRDHSTISNGCDRAERYPSEFEELTRRLSWSELEAAE